MYSNPIGMVLASFTAVALEIRSCWYLFYWNNASTVFLFSCQSCQDYCFLPSGTYFTILNLFNFLCWTNLIHISWRYVCICGLVNYYSLNHAIACIICFSSDYNFSFVFIWALFIIKIFIIKNQFPSFIDWVEVC